MNNSATETFSFKGFLKDQIDVIIRPAAFFAGGRRTLSTSVKFSALSAAIAMLMNVVASRMFAGSVIGAIDFGMSLAMVVAGPLIAVSASFLIAAPLHLLWRILGSKSGFPDSYKCVAYAMGLMPPTVILYYIPTFGLAVAVFWWTCLMWTASVKAHKIAPFTALIIWTLIGAPIAIVALNSQYWTEKSLKQIKQNQINKAAVDKEVEAKQHKISEAIQKEMERLPTDDLPSNRQKKTDGR